MRRHHAGHELSADIKAAPHGLDVLDRYPQVGVLKKEAPGVEVPKALAWLLKHHARMSDMVCRYGGEEFSIILTETNAVEGKMAAERFRRIVEETEFDQQDVMPEKNLTISIGVACFPDDTRKPDELVKKADIALYQAKSEGKNRVVVWAEMPRDGADAREVNFAKQDPNSP